MSYEQIIKDLKTLKAYFIEMSDSVPVCIEEAIRIISELKEEN